MKFSSGAPTDCEVEFPEEGMSLSLPLTFVAPDLARVDAVPFVTETVQYGDVIRVRREDSRRVVFVEVAQPGHWETRCYTIPPGLIDTSGFQEFGREIVRNGGHLEIVLGGLLLICTPANSELDPESEIQRYLHPVLPSPKGTSA